MSRYIDADALTKRVEDSNKSAGLHLEDLRKIRRWIKTAPSIDTEPKRGEWIGYNADKGDDWLRSDGEPIFLVCNKCHGTVLNNTSAHWNFCPNCGAMMDGERKESE